MAHSFFRRIIRCTWFVLVALCHVAFSGCSPNSDSPSIQSADKQTSSTTPDSVSKESTPTDGEAQPPQPPPAQKPPASSLQTVKQPAVKSQRNQQSLSDSKPSATTSNNDLLQFAINGEQDAQTLIAETRQLFQAAQTLAPNQPDMMEMRARLEADFGDATLAAQLREQILQLAPNYTYAREGLAKYYQQTGQLQKAADEFQRAFECNPKDNRFAVQQAVCLSEAGNLELAKSICQEVVKREPGFALAYCELGAIHMQLAENEEAIQNFERAIQIDSRNENAHTGLARALIRAGQRKRAREIAQKQRQIRAANRDALAVTRANYDDTVAIQMDVARHITNLAGMLLAKPQTNSQGLELLVRAAGLSSQSVEPRIMLVKYHQQTRQIKQAIQWQAEVAQIQPDALAPHTQLALLHAAIGDRKTALDVLTTFATGHTDNASVRMVIAQFYVDVQRDLSKAVEWAEEGTSVSKNPMDFQFLAKLYEMAGDTSKSQAALAQAQELAKSSSRNKP